MEFVFIFLEFILLIGLFIWLIVLQDKYDRISAKLKNIQGELKKLINQDLIKSNNEEHPVSQVIEESVVEQKSLDEPKCILDIESSKEKVESLEEDLVQKTVEKNSTDSFERIFLGNIFNKIGAVALLIGLIIFIKLVSPFIVFTPQLKAILGYVLGFGLMLGAFKFNKVENLKNYSEVLMGTSLGTFFITTYCGATLLKLFNFSVSTSIATGFLLLSFFLAQKFHRISVLVISVLAGYVTPIIINYNMDVPTGFLFAYLIFVNILSLIYIFKNRTCIPVAFVNLIMTFMVSCICSNMENIVAPIILWGMYLIYDYLVDTKNISLNIVNYVVFLLSQIICFDSKFLMIGYVQIACASVYLLLSIIKYKYRHVFDSWIHLFVVSLNIAIYCLTKNTEFIRVYAYSLEVIFLAYLTIKLEYKAFANWAIGAWMMGIVSILPIENVLYTKSLSNYLPIWNARLALMSPLVLSAIVASKFFESALELSLNKVSHIFRFVQVSLIYLFVVFEMNFIISKYVTKTVGSISFIQNMINVILGFIYTINMERLYLALKNVLFRVFAIIFGISSLLYLLVTGFEYSSSEFLPLINIRAFAFLLGGLVFLLYSRWTGKEFFKYFAIVMGFLLLNAEINDLIRIFKLENVYYLVSVSWILYAGLVTLCGIFKNKKYLTYSGIVLSLLSISRVFLYDLESVDILYKFVAFLILGLILMLLSYVYNKKQGIKEDEK